jgi:hypothetical protein
MLDPPTPSTIVATIPRWLGRKPIAGETVLIGFSEDDDDLAVCLALSPEREPVDEVVAMRQLVIDGAEAVAIVDYTGSEGGPRLEATHRFLSAAAGRYGHEVLGVLVVVLDQRDRPGYFRSLPDPVRHHLPLSLHYAPTPTEENP